MKYIAICCLILVLLSCSNQPAGSGSTNKSDSLSIVFNNYWEERMKLFPIEATNNGDYRYNDRFNIDFTESFRDTLRQFYTRYADAINGFDTASFNATDRTSYDVFKREMQMQLEGLALHDNYMPFNQFYARPLDIGQFGSGEGNQPFKTATDYHNWIKRVQRFPAWADSAIIYFRKGMASGIVLPKTLVVKMIPQLEALSNDDPEKSVFYGPLRKWDEGISITDRDSISKQLANLISTEVLPAYKRLSQFLQSEYLPKGRPSTGISDVPTGKEMYNYLVRYWTTTNKAPEEIYQTGLNEVTRIRSEIEKTKSAAGYTGDLKSFFSYMRTDAKFKPYRQPKDVLDAFEKSTSE